MRRWLMVLIVLSGPLLVTVFTPGTAFAQECSDFDFQEEAQAFFDEFRDEAADLDADGDGIACEELPSVPVDDGDAPATATTVAAASTGATSATTAATERARASRSAGSAATGSGASTAGAGGLAGTGSNSAVLIGIAMILIGGGALIVRATHARAATFSGALIALRAIYEDDAQPKRMNS